MQIPRRPQPQYVLPGEAHAGLVHPGNIDLLNRPMVRNGRDISTVLSATFTNNDGTAILIPTVIGNGGTARIVSPREALQYYQATKQHLGVFRSNADAERYAEKLHLQQQRLYGGGR